jgi:hypothetical protein
MRKGDLECEISRRMTADWLISEKDEDINYGIFAATILSFS